MSQRNFFWKTTSRDNSRLQPVNICRKCKEMQELYCNFLLQLFDDDGSFAFSETVFELTLHSAVRSRCLLFTRNSAVISLGGLTSLASLYC